MEDKYIMALSIAFSYIPQLDWKNGTKIHEARDNAKEMILREAEFSEEEMNFILSHIYPVGSTELS